MSNIIATIELISGLLKAYPDSIHINVELVGSETGANGRSRRGSGKGAGMGCIFLIRYLPTMAISPLQGAAFCSYFTSTLVKINFDGHEYYLPDCEDFAKWIAVIIPHLYVYAEQELWSL